jgi:hypothetical protein
VMKFRNPALILALASSSERAQALDGSIATKTYRTGPDGSAFGR